MTEPLQSGPVAAEAAEDGKRDLLHDKRALALIGGAVLVIAVGAVLVVPKLSGGSSSGGGTVVAAAHHPAAKATATPSATAPVATAAPSAAPALAVRDPFKALIAPAPAAVAAPSTAPSAAATTAPQAPTVVVVQPSAAPTPTYTVKLDKVTEDGQGGGSAVVELSTKGGAPQTLTVPLGTQFPDAKAGPFLLATIGSDPAHPELDTASFLYGESRFALAIGESQDES